MKTMLITGGAGFIGANFCHYWAEHHPQDKMVVLDALTYDGHRENKQALEDAQQLTFVHGSITDQALIETLFEQHDFDTVVHFAAESHVDRSIDGPDAFIQTNIIGTHTLLKAAKKFWLDQGPRPEHRFHH